MRLIFTLLSRLFESLVEFIHEIVHRMPLCNFLKWPIFDFHAVTPPKAYVTYSMIKYLNLENLTELRISV